MLSEVLLGGLRKLEVKDGIGCFLCSLILKDLEKNGKLTNYPLDYNGSSIFPRTGKESHLKLEGLEAPSEQA